MSDDESIESIEIKEVKGRKEYSNSSEEQTHAISDSNNLEEIGILAGETLPFLPSSVDIKVLKASSAKHSRFYSTLKRCPKDGDSVVTRKGMEQWTKQDVADYAGYQKRKRNGEFKRPLSFLPIPSTDIDALKASNSKRERIRKALGRPQKEGDSVVTSRGMEQWTKQDVADYAGYQKRIKQERKRKALSSTVREDTNGAFPGNYTNFLIPRNYVINQDESKDSSNKKYKSHTDQKRPPKKQKHGSPSI